MPRQELKPGGVFIVGFAGPKTAQFGYQEQSDFAVAMNTYHEYLRLGWDASISYLDSPKSASAFLIFSEKGA